MTEETRTGASRSFADRIRDDAEKEAARVLRDLQRLHFDAREVVRIMRALGIPVDALLAAVADAEAPETDPLLHTLGGEDVPSAREGETESQEDEDEPLSPGDVDGDLPDAAGETAADVEREPERPAEPPAGRGSASDSDVLAYLVEHPGSTNLEIARGLGADPNLVSPRVSKLKTRGLLRTGVKRQSRPPVKFARDGFEYFAVEGATLPKKTTVDKARESSLPTIPLDEVPEELRRMPAIVATETLRPQNIEAARRQLAVLKAVESSDGTWVATEIADATGQPASRVADYLRLFTEVGMVRRTGINRRARNQTGPGRAGVEYQRVGVKGDEQTPAEARIERTVRDVVKASSGQFTITSIGQATGLPREVVAEVLRRFEAREIVRNIGLADAPLYEYVKPMSPGRAAEMDAYLKNGTHDEHGGSAPIPGTGRQLQVRDPDVAKLVADAKKAGAKVPGLAQNGHIIVELPGGTRVQIAATPSSRRTVMNNRAMLRRAGLNV